MPQSILQHGVQPNCGQLSHMLPKIARTQLQNKKYGGGCHKHLVETDTILVFERSQDRGFTDEGDRDSSLFSFLDGRMTFDSFDCNINAVCLVSNFEDDRCRTLGNPTEIGESEKSSESASGVADEPIAPRDTICQHNESSP